MRRLLHGLLLASLLLGACGDDGNGDDRAAVTSIPDDTTTSTTTTVPRTVAPDVIPQDVSLITEEYVEQVLNALYEVSLSSVLAAREAMVVDQRALDLLWATSSAAVFEQRVNDLADLSSADFPGLKAEPQPMRTTVVRLLESFRECVTAEVATDSSALVANPRVSEPGERTFVRLLTATPEQLASGLNPTAWVLDEVPVTLDGSVADVACENDS